MQEDFNIDYDCLCPDCGHATHSHKCIEITCEDGWIDESDEDYLIEGTKMVPCSECKGYGIVRWCPACNKDLSGHHFDDHNEWSND